MRNGLGMARAIGWLGMVAVALLACSGDDDSDGGGGASDGCMPGMFGNACTEAGSGGRSGGESGRGSGAGSGAGSSAAGRSGSAGSGASGSMCPTVNVSASRVVPTVHLVIDGSCSMELDLTSLEPYGSCNIEPGPTTRWGALRNALVDPTNGVVTQLHQLIRFGFYLFGTDPSCPLVAAPLAPMQGQADAIRNAFPMAPPGRNTPTGLALQQVVEMSTTTNDPDVINSPEIILLATDGAPNSCDDSTIDYGPSIQAAMAARAQGTSMYVLSLAEASGEYAAHLQEMADIGIGQMSAPLYTPSSPAELQRDLEALIGGAVGCDVRVNGEVDAARACEGRVTLNGEPLVCGEDWELAEPSLIRLNGAACDRFKGDAQAMVVADWPCGVFEGVD